MNRFQLLHYVTPGGRDSVQEWLDKMRDLRARAAVLRRLDRLTSGNPGDVRFCRDGVSELRIDFGPGYRIYFAQMGIAAIVILCGGDKHTQRTDIERAIRYFQDLQERQK